MRILPFMKPVQDQVFISYPGIILEIPRSHEYFGKLKDLNKSFIFQTLRGGVRRAYFFKSKRYERPYKSWWLLVVVAETQ